jgi:sodium-dependent dicarboxylate transporter 2/3/5
MAGWWVTEAVPLAATSLLPVALFPLLGVATIRQAATPYAHPLIFLFMGGFMMANAMERWGLHRRLALATIRMVGTSPHRLIAGFMIAVAFLSMWVSNTATVIMMVPTGISVVDLVLARLRENPGPDPEARREDVNRFAAALLLGIAYAASIGGIGTLIGTPPNALLAAFLEKRYGQEISFAAWFGIGLPVVLVFLPITWWILTRWVFPFELEEIPGGRDLIEKEYQALGPMKRPEKIVLMTFLAASVLWIGRPWIKVLLPGLNDASIAILGALLLFSMPSGERGTRVLDWKTAARIPWGILLLFGGGLSLASALSRSGVADFLGGQFQSLASLPPFLFVLLVTGTIILLTEFTSNTATTAAFLPILAGVAQGAQIHPFLLMIPAAFAASCAFMLPAATAPNAVVMGSGRITLAQMMQAGIWLNIVGLIWIASFCYLFSGAALGLDLTQLPTWAG